jgi:gas vesicle protein
MNMSQVNWMLGGVALGALTMFLLDPDRGRRRRALARDKMYSAAVKTRKRVDAKSRDLANRAKGLRAEASHILSDRDEPENREKSDKSADNQPGA